MTIDPKDSEEIDSITFSALSRVESLRKRLAKFDLDPEQANRLSPNVHECRSCYYLTGKICGQAFTQAPCEVCGEEIVHPNTAMPKVCSACAVAHGLCRDCGGDIGMAYRRPPRRPTKRRTRKKP